MLYLRVMAISNRILPLLFTYPDICWVCISIQRASHTIHIKAHLCPMLDMHRNIHGLAMIYSIYSLRSFHSDFCKLMAMDQKLWYQRKPWGQGHVVQSTIQVRPAKHNREEYFGEHWWIFFLSFLPCLGNCKHTVYSLRQVNTACRFN